MIELSDFVSQSLVQIARAVIKANEEIKDTNGQVNPETVEWTSATAHQVGYLSDGFTPTVQRIEFDVAVIASEGTQTKGGIAVAVAVVGLGSAGQSDQSRKSESRIRFTVPMMLPYEKLKSPPPPPRELQMG